MNGDRVGLGFLVADRLLLTCAHVVNAALGRELRSLDRPSSGASVYLRFPFIGAANEQTERRSVLADWLPVADAFDQTDVALLHLAEHVEADPLRLVEFHERVEVQMMGPAPNRAHDGYASGVVMGSTDKARLQVDEQVRGVFRARPGFSGGPAWRPGTRDVVGMLQSVGRGDSAVDVYVINSSILTPIVQGSGMDRSTQLVREPSPDAGELVVEKDHATLRFDGEVYTLTQRRLLLNASSQPVTQYLMRIHVERFPYDPIRSHLFHLDNPLNLASVNLKAWSIFENNRRETMRAERLFKQDPATLEVWLEFHNRISENFSTEFPVYSGERRWIEYSYQMPDFQWGPWFQRNVRLKTEVLSVELDFPLSLRPECRGREISVYGDQPLPTPIVRREAGDRILFDWSTNSTGSSPRVNHRYRFDWYFKNDRRTAESPESLSELMQEVGIVQRGDPILGPSGKASAEPPLLTPAMLAERRLRASTQFDLPGEADAARWVIDSLYAAIHRAIERYTYQRGRGITGIAAPQIGIDRAAVIVREPGATKFVELLNPRVLRVADETQNYEGCLSMFDWRGIVARPNFVEVEYEDLAGIRRITQFSQNMARSVMHEIDHLNKALFDEVRVPGTRLIPVDEYRSVTREKG
ncbi:peptide deformylase [Actinoplanes sp. NPDC049118]|uniref:peptide deformylase n=1 Tax=Actinoplanes sp. NPDC049118 TaxID=3155769 RepID=UPI0033D18A37